MCSVGVSTGCVCIVCRVSFRKMGKGGQNNTYKINGGAKGVHAIVHLLGGHLQDYLFGGGGGGGTNIAKGI